MDGVLRRAREVLATLPASAVAGSGTFSSVGNGRGPLVGWRFAHAPGVGLRIEDATGQVDCILYADGRQLFDFTPDGPLAVLDEAGQWRPAPAVPELEHLLRPRELDSWLDLREYALAEQEATGLSPWGGSLRSFVGSVDGEVGFRVDLDERAHAFVTLEYPEDPSLLSVRIHEWRFGEPDRACFEWIEPRGLSGALDG